MVLTNAQIQAFFTEATQMAIPAASVAEINNEGINGPEDLDEYDEDMIDDIASAARRAPYVFGAKSIYRVKITSHLVRYYNQVGRPITHTNVKWTSVGKNFAVEWKTLQDKKEQDDPEIPSLQGTTVMKWMEAFQDWCSQVLGAQNVPLSYVIREDATVPAVLSPLQTDNPFSTEYDSIEGEMIARTQHTGPKFTRDNKRVYYAIEEAV